MSGADDSRSLTSRLRRGDEDALAELLETNGRTLAWWLEDKFGTQLSSCEREDIVLDALTRIWQGRTGLDVNRSLSGYFRRIAKNLALKLLRTPWHKQRQAELGVDPDKLIAIQSPASIQDKSRTVPADLDALLSCLPPRQRSIVEADLFSPPGVARSSDLASSLGIAPSTVRTLRRRALARLRRQWASIPPEFPAVHTPDQ